MMQQIMYLNTGPIPGRRLIAFFFAIVYASILQALPLMEFQDRGNYLDYAAYPLAIFARTAASGPLALLVNEPVWLIINAIPGLFFEAETVLRLIIFFGAFLLSYSLVKADARHSLWLILFMLTPQLLKNNITHIRQGMAMGFFFAGYYSRTRFWKWSLMAIAPFVHSSFFFILPIIAVSAFLRQVRFGVDLRLLAQTGFAVAISLSLSVVAAFLGARQAENYSFGMAAVSGLGFVFWLAVGVLFILQGKSFLSRHQDAAALLVFYLASYFLIDVAARIFESSMPLVLIAGLYLSSWRRPAFLGMYGFYSIAQWVIRLSEPMAF